MVGTDRLGDGHVGHPGLDQHALIVEVHLEDTAQPAERDQHAVLHRGGPAGKAGAGPARHPGDLRAVAGGDRRLDLLGGRRQYHGARGHGVLQQPVRLVGAQLVLVGDHVLGAHRSPQLVHQGTQVDGPALGLGLALRRRALAPGGACAGGYLTTIHSSTEVDCR